MSQNRLVSAWKPNPARPGSARWHTAFEGLARGPLCSPQSRHGAAFSLVSGMIKTL